MPCSSLQPYSSASARLENVLELDGVSFEYPGAVRALNGVSVSIGRGRRTVVMGRNGSGKTTLFSLLNGVAHPSAGGVLFRGEPTRSDRGYQRELRRAVGMVFQDADSQVFSASVREDVSFGPMNLGLAVEEVACRVGEALHDLGIEDLADRPVHALSHGQKKRVCLAGVLAMRPEVLVLDEPFSGLDPLIAGELAVLLTRMHEGGITLVMATHDIDFAYEWADDAVVLDAGRVFASGASREVLARADVQAVLGASPFAFDVARASGLCGGSDQPTSRAALLEALAALAIRDTGERT